MLTRKKITKYAWNSGRGTLVQVKTKTVLKSKEFAQNLVANKYLVRDDETLRTSLVYSSEWNYPNLDRVGNYHFKLNYLINQLDLEMKKVGLTVSLSKVREDALKKDIVVYQKMMFDNETGRLVDYFFILDTRCFKVLVYKRKTDFSLEQNRLFRAIRYLHDEMFMDFEDVYAHLVGNGFDVTEQYVQHIVSEL